MPEKLPPDTDRRFTDQEVALVLQRAAEIEERRATAAPARGLTLPELREIAREVGLGADVIDEAVSLVRASRRVPSGSVLGAPLSHRMVRGVPGGLSEPAMQQLIRLVEDQVEATGTVTEALGTVRWTSTGRGHKFDRTTQVAFFEGKDETQIQVVSRYPSGLRTVMHLLPAAWGGMIGGAVMASSGGSGLAALGVGAGAVLLGAGIGRAIWTRLSRRNARDVERLADDLGEAARNLTSA